MQIVYKFKAGIYWNDREQSIEVGWLMIHGQAGGDQVVDGARRGTHWGKQIWLAGTENWNTEQKNKVSDAQEKTWSRNIPRKA